MRKDKSLVFGVLVLMVALVAVSIAYAGFTQTLNINGTGSITSTSWSVHFANLTNAVTSGTANVTTAATIKSGRTEIGDYAVVFYTPGDSITYKFDVVNDGDYDAKISNLTKGTPTCTGTSSTSNTNVCNNLEYTLTYTTSGTPVAENDTLLKDETKNMTLVLRYKSTVNENQLPSEEVTVGNLGITIQYSQDSLAGGNSSSVVEPTYIYSVSTNTFQIGSAIPTGETTYDNYTSTGKNVFIRHTIENDIITESYVGFKKGGDVYYLQGGDSGESYITNKSTLDTAFGSSNCALYNEGASNEYYYCSVSIVYATVYVNGTVSACSAGDWSCGGCDGGSGCRAS